jgi:hypothetical protein
VKINPNKTVIDKLWALSALFPLTIALCDQVILTPEDNKIIVFNKGNSKGSKVCIPAGGHTQPIHIDGDKLA